MDTPHCDPATEKDALCTTIAALEKSWGKPGMAHAFSDLCEALTRAEQALSSLEQENLGERYCFCGPCLGAGLSGGVCP
jgi:hypothetical protein